MTSLPNLTEIEQAARSVYAHFQATPHYAWATSSARLGTPCWFKHENHTPVGAFKIRGGIVYFEALQRSGQLPRHVVSATRGNHGQSLAWAARHHGVRCTIVVPVGNSPEKNEAMRRLGAELVEHGVDFQASREHAMALAEHSGAHMVPSFHRQLLCGVSTAYWEMLSALPDLDRLYVPIGQGSGVCAALAAKVALGHPVDIVGVVSAHATTYADSLAARRVLAAPVGTDLADGMACRIADAEALDLMLAHALRVVRVTDSEVGAAMRAIFEDTHNVVEGAGAAAFAAALQEREACRGRNVGCALTGGNVDSARFAEVLLAR